MTDENDSNQELKLDQQPESEDAVLQDIDAILAEEDPEFLNQIGKIQIDSSGLDLSIMDQALGLAEEKPVTGWMAVLRKPFEFRSNTRPVVIFWIGFLLSLAAIRVVWLNKDGWLQSRLFLTSYAELGGDVQEYNPATDIEPFYDNPRFAKNLISMSPMFLNLKPSESSGPNPMLAIQVTVEGLSVDAIIEIKDREAEFKDLLARLTEEHTYDELIVPEGKKALCEQYRDLLNTHLTRGQVRRVLLKMFVTNP